MYSIYRRSCTSTAATTRLDSWEHRAEWALAAVAAAFLVDDAVTATQINDPRAEIASLGEELRREPAVDGAVTDHRP